MILGFMQKFPGGKPTLFKEKILRQGIAHKVTANFTHTYLPPPKIHTIREGNRWKPGDLIHMATGVRSKNYNQFNKGIPELQRVKSVQRIDIIHRGPGCALIFIDRELKFSRSTTIGDGIPSVKTVKEMGGLWFQDFIRNDGFDSEDQFWQWFNQPLRNGQLIHWTDLKY